MSDTWKDRPYWVRANDPEEPRRYVRHVCGWLIGKPIKQQVRVKNPDGTPKTYDTVVKKWLKEPYGIPDPWLPNRIRWVYYEEVTVQLPLYVWVTVGFYPNHCVVNSLCHPNREEAFVNEENSTCSYQLRTRYSGPSKIDRKKYHHGSRVREGALLKQVMNTYNSGYDVDDEVGPVDRVRFHKDWWD